MEIELPSLDGLVWGTKEYNSVKYRRYYLKNKERHIKTVCQWQKDNPDKRKAQKRRDYVKNRKFLTYGLTNEDYLKMRKAQKDLCAICKNPEVGTDPRTGELRPLSVDHCHVTKKVRKLLCRRCNTGLGNFRDSVPLLQRVITYLNEERIGFGNG